MNSITKKILALGMILFANFAFAQQTIFGKITNQQNKPIANVVVSVEGTDISTNSKADGSYRIPNLENGTYTLLFDFPNGEFSDETIQIKNSDVQFDYKSLDSYSLGTVEIFGERNKKQRGIEQITRFPVNINDQIQSISVVSEKLIEDQGALTVTDAARNVAGVTQFASYGGTRESMSIRGFRGTPVLKNGVRMDSDFRSAAGISDMSGVESIQVM